MNIKNSKVSILGDSISTYNQAGYKIDGFAMYYPHDDVLNVGDTWWKQVIDAMSSIIEVNASYSGSTTSSMYHGIDTRVGLLGNPDVIFVASGTNDYWNGVAVGEINYNDVNPDISKFAPAYMNGIRSLKQLYPNAYIICVSFVMSDAYANPIREIASHFECRFIDVRDVSGTGHPNKEQMKAIADKIINIITPMEDLSYKNGVMYLGKKINIDGNTIETVDNPEFIEVTTDSEGKIINGTTVSGEGIVGGVNVNQLKREVDALDPEGIKEEVKEAIDEAVAGIGEIADVFDVVDDPEKRLEVVTDKDGKIISYCKEDGIKVENVGIETDSATVNHLNLTESGMTEFQQALKDSGFKPGGAEDFSEKKFVEIPIPTTCAIINIGVDSQAEAKGVDIETYIEFYWGGYYFKKPILLNAQGSSSMRYHWKNQAFDLDDGSKIKFGNWVPQDSFHIKKYYIDVFRGQNNVAYWLAEQIYQTRSSGEVRPWDYLNQNSSWEEGLGSFKKDFNTGALGHPDGFPVKVFFNGVCYGVYALNLKKHRDNYYAKKDNPKNIILDGNVDPNNFFKGAINWTEFEIRNPKNIVYSEAHNGSYKYDADVAEDNIAGNNDGSSTYDTWVAGTGYPVNKIVVRDGHHYINTIEGNTAEPIYHAKNNSDTEPDFKNKTGCGWINCTNTIKVKNYIINFANHAVEIHDNPSKELFDRYMMSKFVMDYCIIGEVLYHHDGFHRNWIWCTWDGVLWAPTVYDLDSIFGMYWDGTMLIDSHPSYAASGLHSISDVKSTWMGNNEYNASKYFHENGIFWDDIKLRYKKLRDKGIISVENIVGLLNKWLDNVGYDNLKEDIESVVVSHYTGGGEELVPNTPSYRDGEKEYEFVPETGGFYNSVMRVKNWLTERIANTDAYYEYSNN